MGIWVESTADCISHQTWHGTVPGSSWLGTHNSLKFELELLAGLILLLLSSGVFCQNLLMYSFSGHHCGSGFP